jgi:hypothetical protein
MKDAERDGKMIPSDNAGMSNEKGKYPRLKLMVFKLK